MLTVERPKTKVHVYRVLRPIFYYNEPLPVGALIELPRWLGENLVSAGRVEPRDKIDNFNVTADPVWGIKPGIVQVQR